MGLPVSQQRILDELEVRLRREDPRLTSVFAAFTRAAHGCMPNRERLTRWRRWSAARWPGRSGLSRRRAWLLDHVPLGLLLGLIGLLAAVVTLVPHHVSACRSGQARTITVRLAAAGCLAVSPAHHSPGSGGPARPGPLLRYPSRP